MKWITRGHVKVDWVACPWLIKKCVDPGAEFLFVAVDRVAEIARTEWATPYDCEGNELGHHGKECSVDAIVKMYGLDKDPALVLLANFVNGADTDNALWHQPESAGLNAIAEGFRQMGFGDDMGQVKAEWIVYDALYAYCAEMLRRGKPNGDFMPLVAEGAGCRRLVGHPAPTTKCSPEPSTCTTSSSATMGTGAPSRCWRSGSASRIRRSLTSAASLGHEEESP